MVSAIDLARLSTAQVHLQTVTVREDDSARPSTAQIYLLPITTKADGVSHYRFSSTLYSTDSLTRYNSQRRCCQLPIQLNAVQHRFTYSL
jgi:hypothetical protein